MRGLITLAPFHLLIEVVKYKWFQNYQKNKVRKFGFGSPDLLTIADRFMVEGRGIMNPPPSLGQ